MAERYFVDGRVGCVAVRDKDNTDPDYPGLHSDTRGVVAYWQGHKNINDEWEVSQEQDDNAKKICEALNNVC